MPLFIGIIGLPNVGKSTLFNALTQGHAEATNYPFCTVEPNVGVVVVPDERLDRLNDILQPESCTPTQIRFVDIAGLVRGASHGEGLGNKFLGHIREADALVHVIRCFQDERVAHVDGALDPVADAETVEAELMLADLETAEGVTQRLDKVLRSDPRALAERWEHEALVKVVDGLQRGTPVRERDLTEEKMGSLRECGFLTSKDVLFVANVGEEDLLGGGGAAERLRERFGPDRVLPISAQIESEILELPVEDREAFLGDLDLAETGVSRLIRAGYQLLNLITFYTVAHNKLQAWQVVAGTRSPAAAGRIHTDMERGFIRAEVASSDELLSAGELDGLRAAGRIRTEGKDYVVQDGDVVQFLFQA